MERRELLRWIASGVVVPALASMSPDRLFATGDAIHRQAGHGPRLLTLRQLQSVNAIAERIIPETDTPGASEARVADFIDLLLSEWYDEDDRRGFLNGLADVDSESVRRFRSSFDGATVQQQDELLADLDDELTRMRESGASTGDNFFGTMKWLTIYGYYTSEVGQKEELDASVIPGRYDPCMPVPPNTPGAR